MSHDSKRVCPSIGPLVGLMVHWLLLLLPTKPTEAAPEVEEVEEDQDEEDRKMGDERDVMQLCRGAAIGR